MNNTERLTCAIVTFNSGSVIASCLEALRSQVDDSQILIYDNRSKDDTLQLIQEISPCIRLLRGRHNIGFGPAINALRPEVRTPYLLLLNPDAILQSGAIDELIDLAELVPQAAILGAVQRTPEGTFVGPEPSLDRYREVEGVFGAAMLLRLACFPAEAPLFDPRFWMYFEDTDLCCSTIERGYKILLANQAVILHKPGSSSQVASPEETLVIKQRQYLEFLVSGYIFAYKHRGRAITAFKAALSVPLCYAKYLLLRLRNHPDDYLMYQRSRACFLFIRRVFVDPLFRARAGAP